MMKIIVVEDGEKMEQMLRICNLLNMINLLILGISIH